jgi:F0F1-type ATP synthase assembly protein I
MALSGLGVELVAVVVGFTFVGFWIDRHYGTAPWALIVCAVFGIVGGLYNFVRAALRASGRSTDRRDRR